MLLEACLRHDHAEIASCGAHFFNGSSVPVVPGFVPVSGALSVGGGTYVTAGVGIGLEEATVGGRAGVSMGW
ncbi:unnamed protein product [marine sediment metagenome]|uniref:Uncharacterized protein n=1 Tax=marine sediment metagenome TaxID=412755 RepID=X0T3I5_9ZZZZ